VTSRINRIEIPVRGGLSCRSNGLRVDRSLLSTVEILDRQLKWYSLGHLPLRSRRGHDVLDPNGDKPHSIRLYGGNVVIGEGAPATAQICPVGAESTGIHHIGQFRPQGDPARLDTW